MTEQEKFEAMMANPEVRELMEDLSGMVCSPEEEKPEYTVLGAMREIIEASRFYGTNEYGGRAAFYMFNDSFVASVAKPSGFLAEQFGIEHRQAVLFSIILELTRGGELSQSELSDSLKADFVEFLAYDEDIRALERALLVKRGRMGMLSIPGDVQNCLRANSAFRKPPVTGLSTQEILFRSAVLLKNQEGNDGDAGLTLSLIDDMVLSNPGTSIARALDRYGILKRDARPCPELGDGFFEKSMSPEERTVFYVMCCRYHERNEDDFGWFEFLGYLEYRKIESLQTLYRTESLDLQRSGVLVCADREGVVSKDRFKIADPVKEEVLRDCGGLHGESGPHETSGSHGKTDSDHVMGMTDHAKIPAKELFYDSRTEGQVTQLERLLSPERYREVEKALMGKGLRPGFTCLFYGAPGTGKTETVYQLARRTGRDIIRVDVSKLKSMWVGESEKNLRTLFSRYAHCVKRSKVAPILLFNEADAIFGIRKAGASDAVDKMENSLQNIILQEMEDLRGILIATTNLTDNLDKAFERRFLYKVRFERPTQEVKEKIWGSLVPELDGDQVRELSSLFPFTGGQIENISRKRLISSVLTGTDPTFEDIVRMCSEEGIGPMRDERPRIGF